MRKIFFICALFLIAISFAMKPENAKKSLVNSDTIPRNTLILLRHAKSDKSNMNMPDIMRPLEESGRKEAEEMGDFLAQQNLKIDKIISSPSVRTKQTLEIICKKINYPYSLVRWDSTLYACSGNHLLDRIKSTSIDYKTVMYVGHNPSITDAANALQYDQQIEEVKTCGAVCINFPESDWYDLPQEKGVLRFYRKPK